MNRVCTLCTCHSVRADRVSALPARNTHRTPLMNCRLSTAVRPTCSTRPGSDPLIRSHYISLNSYRLVTYPLQQQYKLPKVYIVDTANKLYSRGI